MTKIKLVSKPPYLFKIARTSFCLAVGYREAKEPFLFVEDSDGQIELEVEYKCE